MKRLRVLPILALAISVSSNPLAAQATSGAGDITLTLRSARQVSADPGSALTLVVSAQNRTATTLTLTPVVALPERWLVVTGASPFQLTSNAGDLWLLGVTIPQRAEAGSYVVHLGARTGQSAAPSAGDSVVVVVRSHRELSVVATETPSYAINGDSYKASFLVQNRGNSTVNVGLSASSALDKAPGLEKRNLRLAPYEASAVTINVITSGQQASADVVELRAYDETTPANVVTASSLVTVVDQPGAKDPLSSVPAVLSVRGAAPGTSVAPYEFSGGGNIREGRDERVDFLFRGKTPLSSPFGEREEYRVAFHSSHFGAKLGDNYFTLSPLTGAGQTGFGAGLEVAGGPLAAGGYAQRFRFLPSTESERGAFVRLQPWGESSPLKLTVNGVERVGGLLAGRVISPALSLSGPYATQLDVEAAASTSEAGNGRAESVRLSGGDRLRFDLSHTRGDSAFAGPVRGLKDEDGNASLLLIGGLRVIGGGSLTRYEPLKGSSGFIQGYQTLSSGIRYNDRLTLEYATVNRVDSLIPGRLGPTQRLFRGRIDQPWAFGNSWISAETGQRLDSLQGGGMFHEVLGGTSLAAAGNWISVFGEYYDGGSLQRGPVGTTTFGGSASLHLTPWNTLTVFGYGSRTKAFKDRTGTQVDARFTQAFIRGSTISARVRYSALLPGYPPQTLFYTEFSLPFGVPTGRIHIPGRISGRVTDAETGQGVSGALVRLGPKAAVTDKNGVASFTGLAPGVYRVSLAGEAKLTNSAIHGNPVVEVDSTSHANQTFSLQVEAGTTIRGTVRQYGVFQTSLTASPDSLVDNGPLAGVTIAIINGADTLYHVSDSEGKFAFTEIGSGVWLVQAQGDVPPSMAFEHTQFSIATSPGEDARVEFRLLPRKRPVIIDEQVPPPLQPEAPSRRNNR